MSIYPTKAIRFLRNAESALENLNKAKNGDEARKQFDIFLESSRQVIFHLEGLKTEAQGFDEWYLPHRKNLETDRLCKFFYRLRNDVVKGPEEAIQSSLHIRGPVKISGPVRIGPGGIQRPVKVKDVIEWRHVNDFDEQSTHSWAMKLPPEMSDQVGKTGYQICQEYLNKLEIVVHDFMKQFGEKQ